MFNHRMAYRRLHRRWVAALAAAYLIPGLCIGAVAKAAPIVTVHFFPAPLGCSLIPPSSITTSGSGATTYTYSMNGAIFTQITPPTNFDPASATMSQLAQYGYPVSLIKSGTTTGAEARNWLSGPETIEIGLASCPQIYTGRPTTPSGTDTSNTQVTSYDNAGWSGVSTVPEDSGYAGYQDYTSVAGSYHQAAYNECATDASASTWVGIGGLNGAALLQTGTQAIFGARPEDFAEFINASGSYNLHPTGPSVSGYGDTMIPSVSYSVSGGYVYISKSVLDYSTGSSWSVSEKEGSGFNPATTGGGGSMAEAIDERPVDNATKEHTPLSQPTEGYVAWQSFNATLANGTTDIYPNMSTVAFYDSQELTNDNPTLMSPAGNGSGFRNDWIACGKAGPIQSTP